MLIRKLQRSLFTEWYVTILGTPSSTPSQSAHEVYDQLAPTLAASGLLPLQERAFGPLSSRGEVLAVRESVLSNHGLAGDIPVTYMSRKPAESKESLGVQLWGVVPAAGSDLVAETVKLPGGFGGRLLSGADFRLLWLSALVGTDEGGELAESPAEQAERMFVNARRALEACDLEYRDVARTWISLRRLLDWYDDLNRVRTAFHSDVGITGGPAGRPFPASTGIQGCVGNEECVMDLLAVRGGGPTAPTETLIRSSRQEEPFAYGSGFSRGVALSFEGGETLHISGTASVGSDGRTKHIDDRDAQALETLLAIAALLEPRGARLQDICAGTLFYKDAAALSAYRQVTSLLGIAELPLVPVMADVCRSSFLIEIEAIAGVGATVGTAE